MTDPNTARREAIKALVRSIMKASLIAARRMDSYVPGLGKVKASQMNRICAEYLHYHMWMACKRALTRMNPEAFRRFRDNGLKTLAVVASGCFTGLFDAKAEAEFMTGLHEAFARYDKCGSDAVSGRNPLTGDYPLAAVARRVAEFTGHTGDEEVTMQAMVAGMESINVAGVNDLMNWVIRAG